MAETIDCREADDAVGREDIGPLVDVEIAGDDGAGTF